MNRATCWKDGHKDESIEVSGTDNLEILEMAAEKLNVKMDEINVIYHEEQLN